MKGFILSFNPRR